MFKSNIIKYKRGDFIWFRKYGSLGRGIITGVIVKNNINRYYVVSHLDNDEKRIRITEEDLLKKQIEPPKVRYFINFLRMKTSLNDFQLLSLEQSSIEDILLYIKKNIFHILKR